MLREYASWQPVALSCLFGAKVLKANRCVAKADKLLLKPSSIRLLSINVALKEISWSRLLGPGDGGADLTDDISADISALAAFQ